MATEKRVTLGTNVLPIHYDIAFDVSMKKFSFTGKSNITANVTKPSNKIKLNVERLEIISASITAKGKSYPAMVSHNEKEETSELSIAFLVSGQITITIEFSGEIKENASRGFYKSKYLYKGKSDYILTTQFEPVDARCAFPCFDEPAMKATFDLSFVVDRNLTVISNTDVKSEKRIGPGKKMVTFNRTPKMSTYLVYFGIGPFEIVTSKIDKITLRVITTPGKSDRAGMAIKFAKTFLKFYENYFYIKYPLPKLDLIAIPDFSAGASAMENWGAITFREAELLGKESELSFNLKRRIATVIAHEIAHQWFGDLVTMKWWDDLWLNESFATFMEKKTLDELYPDFKRGLDALTGETGAAFADDALKSTHPINVTVNDPSEIGAIFDLISYYKGSAVLAMIEDFASPAIFRKGLHKYFKEHLYSNAVKDDLWRAMRQAGGKSASDLPAVSSFWIDNPGYPMVSAQRKNGTVALSQSRFTILPYKQTSKPWPIPIRYIADKKEGFYLMKGATGSISVGDAKFVKLNFRQKGFYRVMYDKKSLAAIGNAIKEKKISSMDSYGVISDLSTLARACRIKASDIVDFMEAYCMDSEYPVNSAISSYCSALQLRFPGTQMALKARLLGTQINRKILKKVGWVPKKGEDSMVTLQRSSAIRNSGISNDQAVLAKCGKLFAAYVSKKADLHPDIKTSVYLALSFNGDAKLFDRFVAMYKKQDSGEEIMRLGAAIGTFNNATLAKKALVFAMSKSVRVQDKNSISAYVSSVPEGKEVFLKWIKADWQKIRELYKGDVSGLGRFVEDLDDLDTAQKKLEVTKFFYAKSNYTKDIKRTLESTLESIETNIRFMKYNS
jgi:tricorn protease interacting factor F2/3